MTEAVLLELEGVVVDTLPLRAAALVEALVDDGIELGLDEATEVHRGRSVRRAVAAAALDAHVSLDLVAVDLAAARAEERFAGRIAAGGALLKPNAATFVRDAAAAVRCALVTRASRGEAETILRLAGLGDAFETIVALEDVVDDKPAPSGYRAALGRLERRRPVAPRAVVALEDGGAGARAARAAGIVCIVVGPAPASEAVEGDAYLPGLEGATMDTIRSLAARAGAGTS